MASQVIRAIETNYAGCRFRSRLEARWAVFFDHLGITWEYEAEGYETSAGRYLPDFHLDDGDLYVEVKGAQRALDDSLARISAFVTESGRPLIVLGQMPATGEGATAIPAHSYLAIDHDRLVACSAVMAQCGNGSTMRWRFLPLRAATAGPHTEPRYLYGVCVHPDVADALRAARSARFERGERG